MSSFCPCHRNWWSKCPRTCFGTHKIDAHTDDGSCVSQEVADELVRAYAERLEYHRNRSLNSGAMDEG